MNSPNRYVKKPVTVDAIQYLPARNCRAVYEFLGWNFDETHSDDLCNPEQAVHIHTLGGLITGDPGDWIIRGVKGGWYSVCPADIFEVTYSDAALAASDEADAARQDEAEVLRELAHQIRVDGSGFPIELAKDVDAIIAWIGERADDHEEGREW